MNLTLITDATQEPVTLADAKLQLTISEEFRRDDALICGLITAARLQAEAYSRRDLAQKTWKLTLDRFPTNYVNWRVAYPVTPFTSDPLIYQFSASPDYISLLDPLISVSSLTYKDGGGTTTAMVLNADYVVDTLKHPGVIAPYPGTMWPAPSSGFWPSSAVQCQFVAGHPPEACPQNYKQGILLLVTQWYENRVPFEAIRFVAELPFSVSSLFGCDPVYKF